MSRRTIETTQYYRNKKHKRRELIKRDTKEGEVAIDVVGVLPHGVYTLIT